MTTAETEALLSDWLGLQRSLRSMTTSRAVLPLLRMAVARRVRLRVTARIYARFNKLRAAEERSLLERGSLPTYLLKPRNSGT